MPFIYTFQTMNNVTDPADLRVQPTKTHPGGECVDLVNVDTDNDSGISVRAAVIDGLVQHPVGDTMGARRYWAVGNTVYCSVALSDAEDKRYSTVISLDDMITMIIRVDGGLYVGSTKETHYLHGTDPQAGGFQDQWTLPYGVIMGTALHVRGELVPVAQMQGNCAIWASQRGVMVGGPGGITVNLSQNKVSYPYGLTGKAWLREQNGLVHYLFQTSDTNAAYNLLPDLNLDIDSN